MNYIKSIIVADDEPLQCETLERLLRKIVPDAEINTVSNGMAAWEFMQQHPVDVLITDIQMPVMDGMELIRRTAEQWPEINVVLISAYQEFEYVRKALEFRAVDYLLKPFRTEMLSNVVEKINKKLESRQKDFEQISYYEKIEQLYQKDLKIAQLASLLRGKITLNDMEPEMKEKLSVSGIVMILRWKKQLPGKQEGITGFQQENLLKNIYTEFSYAYFVPLDKGVNIQEQQMAVIAPGITEAYAVRFMEEYVEKEQQKNTLFWCGISAEYENLAEKISEATNEAEEMVKFSFFTKYTGGVFPWESYKENLDRIPKSLSTLEKKIREQIHKGNIESVIKKLDELEREYEKTPYIAAFRLKYMISSMTMRIIADLEGILSRKEYDELINEAYELYGVCDSREELFEISRKLFQSEAAYFGQESGNIDRVNDVISYIKRHYRENLSLQELSEKVHFSPNYLSARIKQHTGMTYSEYLMSLRMKEAVNLLLHTDCKVVEIVSACGFNDSSYFNRIFRRTYNMSPEKYRKVHKNVEEIS